MGYPVYCFNTNQYTWDPSLGTANYDGMQSPIAADSSKEQISNNFFIVINSPRNTLAQLGSNAQSSYDSTYFWNFHGQSGTNPENLAANTRVAQLYDSATLTSTIQDSTPYSIDDCSTVEFTFDDSKYSFVHTSQWFNQNYIVK